MPSPFTFSTVEPAAGSSPGGVSRDAMQKNNQSTFDILAVDHVTFNNTTGGLHKQVTYVNTESPSSPISPSTIAFTIPGQDDPTTPQNMFITQKATVPMSAVRAFCTFIAPSSAPGTIIPQNQWNVDPSTNVTVTNPGGGIVIFSSKLIANAVSSNKVVVLITLSDVFVPFSPFYVATYTGGVLQLNIRLRIAGTTFPQTINYVVLQM